MKRGEPLYIPDNNPHMSMKPLGKKNKSGTWLMQCTYCGEIGTYNRLNKTDCTEVHKPCPYCGCTPICAWDCKGIGAALARPDVYIAGGHD